LGKTEVENVQFENEKENDEQLTLAQQIAKERFLVLGFTPTPFFSLTEFRYTIATMG